MLELYGLVSIIDDFAFGDLKTYRARFTRLGNDADFNELKVNNENDIGTANGSVGSNGPRISINNEHGTIDIRKGSMNAEVPEAPPAPKGPKAPKVNAPPEPTDN